MSPVGDVVSYLSQASVEKLSADAVKVSHIGSSWRLFPKQKMHGKNPHQTYRPLQQPPKLYWIWLKLFALLSAWALVSLGEMSLLCISFGRESTVRGHYVHVVFSSLWSVPKKSYQSKRHKYCHLLLLYLESPVFQQQSLASIPGEAFIPSMFASPSQTS